MGVTDDCQLVVSQHTCHPVNRTEGQMCGYTAEDYAEAALKLEPLGLAWCKDFGTIKAALYRAFGSLLAFVDKRICDLVRESRPCDTHEMLNEWEVEFGLPSVCMQGIYPQDIDGRKRQVCAAYLGTGIQTLKELESLLQTALGCPQLRLEITYTHNTTGQIAPTQFGKVGQPLTVIGHVCVYNITAPQRQYIHNVVGGWGEISDGQGSSAGQPLMLSDPDQVMGSFCPIVWHNVVGGWYGGVGNTLTLGGDLWQLLVCLMDKHLPAHVGWEVCN